MIERIYGLETELSIQTHPHTSIDKFFLMNELLEGLKSNNRFIFAENKDLNKRTFFYNGSCAYIDNSKCVELALPECNSVYETVACDRAGMHMIEEAAENVRKHLFPQNSTGSGEDVFVYKNNVAREQTVGKNPEVTYGTHENYSVNTCELLTAIRANKEKLKENAVQYRNNPNPEEPIIYLGMFLLPFLVSRQIICGAGSVIPFSGRYEIAQRSRFLSEDFSGCTTSERGIVNTKNESLCSGYIRLHLICGDANMSQHSNYLKIGATGIMVRMIEENYVPPFFLILPDSIVTLHKISKDTACKELYGVFHHKKERMMSAIDIQQCYLDLAKDFLNSHKSTSEEQYILYLWQFVLDGLRNEPKSLFGVVDWITKKVFLDEVSRKTSLPFAHPQMESLDLLYHALNRKKGKYYQLEARNDAWKAVGDEYVEMRKHHPPHTRALARAKIADALKLQGAQVEKASWESIHSDKALHLMTNPVSLTDPFDTSIPENLT